MADTRTDSRNVFLYDLGLQSLSSTSAHFVWSFWQSNE